MNREVAVATARALFALLVAIAFAVRAAAGVATSALGATALLGDTRAIDAELCRDLLTSARSGERVWIRSATDAEDRCDDPLAACGASAWEIVVDPTVLHAGDDRAIAERVRSAGAIVITGGRYLDWYAVLTPADKRSGLCLALVEARKSGALLVASGAAGAFLAERTLVDRAALHRPLRNPRDAKSDVAVNGLGLVLGVFDATGAPHASFARLVDLSSSDAADTFVFLDGSVAWIERESTPGVSEVRGAGAALVLDLHNARRENRALRGARLAVLADGDRWSARDHSVTSAARALVPVQAGSRRAAHPAASVDAASLRAEIARAFGAEPAASLVLAARERTLTLALDADSRFGSDGARATTFARLVLDVEWNRP